MDSILDKETIKQRIIDSVNKSNNEKQKSKNNQIEDKIKSNNQLSDDDKKKAELKQKLRSKINAKKHASILPKSEIDKQKNNIMQMINNPKITPHMLKLYIEAIAFNPELSIPSPLDILNDREKHLKEYYEYILAVAKSMKANGVPVSDLDKALDNPFGYYMSTCLECKINPFSKSKKVKCNNPECKDPDCFSICQKC